MSDGEENHLFNIQVSDSEEDTIEKKTKRTGQSEDEFQAVKSTYRAKVENGNVRRHDNTHSSQFSKALAIQIHGTIQLPLAPDANKQHVQEVIHAAEELYFFRRYQHVIDLVSKVLALEGDNGGLDDESKQLLSMYQSRCRQKLKQTD